jgi:leucyl-tRNA synthetase
MFRKPTTRYERARAHRRELELEQRAHRHRQAPTESEARLWEALRGSQLGVAFRRQVVLAERYIADFVAPSAKLVVEVDGGCHAERKHADARRDRCLRRMGYRVVRVTAEMVLEDLGAAVGVVREAVGRWER